MSNVTQEIAQIDAKISSAKQQRAQAEGSLQTILASLKTDFGVSTLEEAEVLRDKLAKDIEESNQQLESQMAEIRTLMSQAGV